MCETVKPHNLAPYPERSRRGAVSTHNMMRQTKRELGVRV